MIRRPIREPLRALVANSTSEIFLRALNCANNSELEAICRLFLAEGIPVAFSECPIEYEFVRVYVADALGVPPKDIGLVGSARIGFSLSPKKFPTRFSPRSDLDIFVVSQHLFDSCLQDALRWCDDIQQGRRQPKTNKQGRIWSRNFSQLGKIKDRGFFDPKSFLEDDDYPSVQKVRVTMRRVKRELGTDRDVSARVYRDWERFYRRNIFCLRELQRSASREGVT